MFLSEEDFKFIIKISISTLYSLFSNEVHILFYSSEIWISSKNVTTKGQIKRKADWRAVDSPKKGTNKFVFFCCIKQESKKPTNSFLRFLGKSTTRQSALGFIWPLRKHWLRIQLWKYLLRLIHLNVKWKRHHNLLYNFYWHLWYWNGCTYTLQCHLYNKKEA